VIEPRENTPSAASPGDRPAEFVRLLSSCERRLYNYVFALVGNFDDADEVIQETNIRLWEQFDQFRPEADFGAWACTVALYQVLSFRKRSARQGMQLKPEFFETVSQEVLSRSAEFESRQRALGYCLDRLSEFDRSLVLRSYDGKSAMKDVAESIGRTVTATYQLLFRIRNKLHRCIERSVQAEGR
jgi:RNA polymerase sigma-70 factor (ECF subfamily)